MKVFFRNIHLYLSLAAGLVIMTCCFTGAVLVFEKELQEAFNHDRYFVKQENLQLPLEKLVESVKQKFPTAKISSVKIYPDPARSVEVSVSIAEKGTKGEAAKAKHEGRNEEIFAERKGRTQVGENRSARSDVPEKNAGELSAKNEKRLQKGPVAGGGRPSHTVFVNPYTANIIELYSYRETFFYTMFSLHRWLLGGDDSIGKIITGVATFIFLFILITGIILWWPRNKAILKRRLKIKTGVSWKRLNHDLHIVLGFYSAILLFIFAFTALAWSFKWFNDGIYTITKSSMKPAELPNSAIQTDKQKISYDSAFIIINNAVGDVQYYSLRAPADSAGVFTATVLPVNANESAADNYYIDQYSGRIIGSLKFKDKNLGQRVRATFKPVHVGSVYGWPSKIIAFLVCILGVTFPITGVIMWINRLKIGKKKNRSITTLIVENDQNE